ncbi:MAG: hypothetical protein LC634_09585 [Sphingomonadales bacterium]|nr:hypothetical protein [Sphingomonadales bacterium]
MRLIIHGGYYKTGTTAFQRWLHASRDRLSGMGIFVPDPGPNNNHGFALNASIRAGREELALWPELEAAARRGHGFAIVSAETIASYFARDFEVFHDRVRDYDPVLFMVLRHWREYLPSKHAQDIRRGDWLTLPGFLSRLERDHDRHPDANFGLPFRRAHEAGFGSLLAVGYGGDVALDIVAELTGIAVSELDGGQWPERRVNRRLDPLLTERIRMLNAIAGPHGELFAGHAYDGALDPTLPTRFLLLTEVTRRLSIRHPELIAKIDACIEAEEVAVSMAEYVGLFDRWRADLRRTLSEAGVEDRLGAFEAPAEQETIRASLAESDRLPAALRERIYRHIVKIRGEVWNELKERRSRDAGLAQGRTGAGTT